MFVCWKCGRIADRVEQQHDFVRREFEVRIFCHGAVMDTRISLRELKDATAIYCWRGDDEQ